tara:strand:+ start:1171 stop:1359 length:189 start_codon:yes stop_codon:yes gene_type:complete
MPTPQEELIQVKARLDANIVKVQEIQGKIKKLQEEGQSLTQPIMEDQGALKVLEKLISDPAT